MRISGHDPQGRRKLMLWLSLAAVSGCALLILWPEANRHNDASMTSANEAGRAFKADPRNIERNATNQSAVANLAAKWITESWNVGSFKHGLAIAADASLVSGDRRRVIQRLVSKKRAVGLEELLKLKATLVALVQNWSEDSTVRAEAIHALAGVAVMIAERNGAANPPFSEEYRFLIQYSADPNLSLTVRSEAIRAIGDLRLSEGVVIIEALLSTQSNVDEPLIARNACISLQKILGEKAVPALASVLRSTWNEPVFGSAAYSLGQIGTAEAMAALVANRGRFPDNHSCDASLSEMGPTIVDVLRDSTNPHVTAAVSATESMWREGQIHLYKPALHQLLLTGPFDARKAALERLLNIAAAFDLDREKQELAVIREEISTQSEFREQETLIARRLAATLVTPAPGLRGPPTIPKN